MKGSDVIGMTIDIGGELITLDVDFDEQNSYRDTERAVKLYLERIKKIWPEKSDRNLIAMAAFQFARSYHQLLKIQEELLEATNLKINQIDSVSLSEDSVESDNM